MQRAIIIITLILLSFGLKAQVYQAMPQAGYGPVKRFLVDSVLTIPQGITSLRQITGGRDIGQIRWNGSDTGLYIYNGVRWQRINIDTTNLVNEIAEKLNITDTASLSNRINQKADKITTLTINGVTYDLSANRSWTVTTSDTVSLSNRINLKLNIADTSAMLSPYLRKLDTVYLSNRIDLKLNASDTASLSNRINRKQDSLILTTIGTTGNASLIGATLNIPSYSTTGFVPYTGATSNVLLGLKSLNGAKLSADTSLQIKNRANSYGNATFDYTAISSDFDNFNFYTIKQVGGQNYQNGAAFVYPTTDPINNTRSYNLPVRNGTIALVEDTVILSNRINLKADKSTTLSINGTTYDLSANRSWTIGGVDTTSLSNRINTKLNISDTASMLSPYLRKADTSSLSNRIDLRVKYSDTASMLSGYQTAINSKLNPSDTVSLNNRINTKQGLITLTTNNNSGVATFISNVLNIPNYTIDVTGFVPYVGATTAVNLGAFDLTVNELTIGKGLNALSNNTALGYRSLYHTTTGNFNTSVGYQSGHNITTGQYNTTLGQSAMFTNNTGSQNTAIGVNSLLNNTSGGSNVVVGLDAMQHNTTGNSNTALGYNAGTHLANGTTPNETTSTSVYIGRDTKASASGNANEIVVGYNAIGNGSNTVTIGNSSVTANYLKGSVNAGSFVKSGGTSSQFLKADGSVDSNIYISDTTSLSNRINLKLNISDTASMLSGYQSAINSKQAQITLTTTGTSGAATFSSNTLNIPQYQSAGTYVTSVTGTSPIVSSGGTTPAISIPAATSSVNGYLTSTDWTAFNGKQNAINGTGFVKASGTTISYDNSSYYLASNPNGYNTGTVTSVATGLGLSGGTITTSGTLLVDTASASILSRQRAANTYLVPSSLSGYVPYTGATTNVTLGSNNLQSGGDPLSDVNGVLLSNGGTVDTRISSTIANSYNFNASRSANGSGYVLSRNGYLKANIGVIGGGGSNTNDGVMTFGSYYQASSGSGINDGAFTELMRLNPSGVGNATLDVTGSGKFTGTAFFGGDIFTYNNGGIFFSGASTFTSGIFQNAAGLQLQSGGSPRLTIASTGAATFSGTINSTVGNNGALLSATTATTGYQYIDIITTSGRTQLIQESSVAGTTVTNSTAYASMFGSAVAKDVILFTNGANRLKLDGSTGAATFSGEVTAARFIGSNTITDPTVGITTATVYALNGPSSNNTFGIGLGAVRNSAYDMWFQTGAINGGGYRWYIGTTEKMTITSAGNVLIGTTTDNGAKLQVNGAATFSGNVGIGTTSSVLLHLAKSSAANQLWLQSTTGTNAAYMNFINSGGNNFLGVDNSAGTGLFATGGAAYGFSMVTESAYPLLFGTNNAERMRITSGGNVGIGRTPTTNILEINGDASKTTAGLWLANSDLTIKTEINTIDSALDRINKVRLVSFKYKDEYKTLNPSIKDKFYQNVIAQEFQKIYPDYVYQSGDIFQGKDILQVDTNPMYIDAVASIQELSKLVKELSAKNEALIKRIETLENK